MRIEGMSAEHVFPSLPICSIKVAGDVFGITKEDLVLIVPDTGRDRSPRSIGILSRASLFFVDCSTVVALGRLLKQRDWVVRKPF